MRPQQRLYLLKHHLVPKLMHSLALGRVDKTELDLMDKRIRVSVRSWLKLPNDVSKAYLYADKTDGGAAVPILGSLVRFAKQNRFKKIRDGSSNDSLLYTLVELRSLDQWRETGRGLIPSL